MGALGRVASCGRTAAGDVTAAESAAWDSGDGDADAGAVVPVLPGQRADNSPRRRMASFVQGLPVRVVRVNCWSTAELAGDEGPSRGMQRLLSTAAWAEAGVARISGKAQIMFASQPGKVALRSVITLLTSALLAVTVACASSETPAHRLRSGIFYVSHSESGPDERAQLGNRMA